MLEKIFGKKSTGVVYILSAGFILLALGGAYAAYFAAQRGDLYALYGMTAFSAFELLIISLPVFLQKKLRLYIPPAIEIGLCLYSALFFAVQYLYIPRTGVIDFLLPFLGGFVFAMPVFSILYSLLLRRGKGKKRRSVVAVSVLSFFATAVCILCFSGISFLLVALFDATTAERFLRELAFSSAQFAGTALFCLIGGLTAHSHRRRFAIRSFKDTDRAKEAALKEHDKTELAVIENISGDSTDYRRLFGRAKAQFFLARIVYLALYAGYAVFTGVAFRHTGKFAALVSALFAVGFVLTALVYVYEYYLLRHGQPNQRLRRLKIAKIVVRLYSLALVLASTVGADFAELTLSAAFSLAMAAFNLCMLFYNLFGKPRRYPAAPPLRRKAHGRQEEAAAQEDTGKEGAQSMPAAGEAGAQGEDEASGMPAAGEAGTQGEEEAANGKGEAAQR